MAQNLYGSKEVILSRDYEKFGKTVKANFGKRDAKEPENDELITYESRKVTSLTVQEFTGADDLSLSKIKDATIYDEIALCCGLTIEEARSLARADTFLIQEVMNSFLYDSELIKLSV
jgi:hypothetical protein